MSKSDEIIKAMHAAAPDSATIKNSVRSPLTGTASDDNWQLVFNGPLPPKIQFYSYGAKFTVHAEVSIPQPTGPDKVIAYSHPFSPNGVDVLDIPAGAVSVYAEVKDVFIEKQDTASIVVTF